MSLNPELENRVYMHTMTHVLYRVETGIGPMSDPYVVFSKSDGVEWRTSTTYKNFRDFIADIHSGVISMKFVARQDDIEGVKYIRSQCLRILEELASKGQPGASKREGGIREGKVESMQAMVAICDEVLDRAVLKDGDKIQPADAETPEETDESKEDTHDNGMKAPTVINELVSNSDTTEG